MPWNARALGAHASRIEQVAAARDAFLAVSADGVLAVWPLDGRPPRVLHRADGGATSFASDGEGLVLGTEGAVLRLPGAGAPRTLLAEPDRTPVAIDTRRGWIAIAMHDEARGSDHPIAMLDATGKELWRATLRSWPYDLAIDPDGRSVAVACWDQRVARFDAVTGRALPDVCAHQLVGPAHALAWLSPTQLAIATLRGQLAIADVAADRLVLDHRDADGLHAIARSPDGRWLATGGNAGVVAVWDLASRTCAARYALADAARGIASHAPIAAGDGEASVGAPGGDPDGDPDDDGGGGPRPTMFPSHAEFYDVGGPAAICALAFDATSATLCAGLEGGGLVTLARS